MNSDDETWPDTSKECPACGKRIELKRYPLEIKSKTFIASGWKCCQELELPASEKSRLRKWLEIRAAEKACLEFMDE